MRNAGRRHHRQKGSLGAVLNPPNQYVIPFFQRDYRWDQPEWKTLWDDLAELLSWHLDCDGPGTLAETARGVRGLLDRRGFSGRRAT